MINSEKIIRKYKKLENVQNYIKFHNPVAIEQILFFLKKLYIKNYIEKRLEAERIVRWYIHIQNSYVRNIYKILANY